MSRRSIGAPMRSMRVSRCPPSTAPSSCLPPRGSWSGTTSAPAAVADTAAMADADVIQVNARHIPEKAAEKVYSDLGRIRQVKEVRRSQGKETIVAVAGCVAQAAGSEIVRRAPVVDVVVGP